MRRAFVAAVLAVGLGVQALPAAAQAIPADTAQQILQELRSIRGLLEARQREAAAPPTAPNDRVAVPFAKAGFTLGRADAPLVMVEYTDYECPFCRQYHLNTFEQIQRNYVDTGKVRYVSRDFPLDIHKNAPRAAAAARCASEQGKFWELRHSMIANASKLEVDHIAGYAKELKLDLRGFAACMQSGRHNAAVEADMAEGRNAGVSGTPSFVIGRLVNGRIEGVRMVGAMPYMMFAAKLDEMLKRADVD